MIPILFKISCVLHLLQLLICSSHGQISDVVIAGTLGRIRGTSGETVLTKRPYYQFFGIPYANSTAGNNRFIPTELNTVLDRDDGDSTYNATEFSPPCAQSGTNSLPNGSISEDCLGINIWTPANNIERLPVIVFIHGGSFMDGNGNAYSGGRLLERDVVVVSFNYRLGILGFFCLNDENAPGNAAMYDMITALRWIKSFIEYFGGDPNLVTISGQSAGSAAVVQLMLSPIAKAENLFHRVIAASGSALNNWGTSKHPFFHSVDVARFANCYNGTDEEAVNRTSEIIQCMRTANASTITEALQFYQAAERKKAQIGFGPVSPAVQRTQLGALPIFLHKDPIDILNAKEQLDVPLMIGATKHDGSFVLTVLYYQYLMANGLVNDTAFLKTRLITNVVQALGLDNETKAVSEALAFLYLGEARKSGNFTEMIPGLIDIHSIFYFKAGAYQTAELHSSLNSDTYWYSFDFFGRFSLPSILDVIPQGVGHAHDMVYLFPFMDLNEEELVISNTLVNYWANFALTGNPNRNASASTSQEWPKFSEENPRYIQIGNGQFMNTSITIEDNYQESWKDASLELVNGPEISAATLDSKDFKKERDVYLALFIVFLVTTVVSSTFIAVLYRKLKTKSN